VAVASLERPDMTSRFGQMLLAGAGLAGLAMLLLGVVVVFPTVAASRRGVSLT
jgi:hypothetical protein